MKKVLWILALGLLWCNVSFAKNFFVGQEISNNFIYNKDIQINLSGNNWVVIRKNTQLEHVKQKIVGIGRVKDNEIMEMIEIYEGALAGYYIKYVDPIIIEIVFKDKHDGCYERSEYYLLEFYRKGSTHNCMRVGHFDVTKELNYPDGPHDKAAAAAYNRWIKQSSISYPKIMLFSHHSYFSRLTGGKWYQIFHLINPKIFNPPKSKFFTEETSEYHKANISQYPKHQKIMSQWISVSSQFHKNFENMIKAKSHHRLPLDQYLMETTSKNKKNNELTDQLKKLNELYKAGVLTKEEFTKAKNKILN